MPNKRLLKPSIDRFAGRPGGTGLAPLHKGLSGAADGGDTPSAGLTDALTNIAAHAASQGLSVINVRVDALAPHPMNRPERSLPQPGNPKWEELVLSVRENGVRLPGLAVTKDAFLKARPNFDGTFPDSVTHVAVYAHRRRIAAITASQPTMPMIVDDSILENDGDLDAMTWENWGREDLDPFALGEQFALYSDVMELSQRGIATRLGISQPTVQRHMALMLLVDEAKELVREKRADQPRLSLVAAAELVGKLPYGAKRRWQDKSDPEQSTEERAADQRAAIALITNGSTVERAVSQVVAERRARATADSLGLEVISPVERFGANAELHRLAALPEDRSDYTVLAAVDPYTGSLAFYAAEVQDAQPATNTDEVGESAGSDETTASDSDRAALQSEDPIDRASTPQADDAKERASAQKARRRAAALLASRGVSRDRLGAWLTAQFRWRVSASDNPRAWSLALAWLSDAGLVAAESVQAWQATVEVEPETKVAQRAIWAVALAASELRASDKKRAWDGGDVAYLDILRESEGFTPSDWEAQQVRSVQANAGGTVDNSPDDGDSR
ncbi:ParB/RepB/Spo0J family partition protein [Nocardia salmonicida]|uniref:ParB/RepB/Spo0J family partition protein n=1 Tax=Nocardia salmonicida TaxID=53431 RepID=UPI00378B6D62